MYITLKRRTIVMIILSVTFGILLSAVIKIYAKSEKKELIVLMYHSVLKDKNYTGKYVVTPESLENDIKALKERGYKSVLPKEVIAYTKGVGELPDKPYMITFDDGTYNTLTYLLPILEKYDECAAINIVGSYSENFSESGDTNPAYSYLKWSDIKYLYETERIEIGNHSYDLHSVNRRKGATIKKYEDEEAYKKLFVEDTLKTEELLINNSDIKPDVYAYPFGAYCDISEEILKDMGYKMTFTCEEGINKIENGDDLYLLKRYNRSGFITTEEFLAELKID